VSLVRLVPRPRADIPIDRLWLVFFGEAEGAPWWSRLCAPGYRHVAAAAWFDDQERWVYFNPTRRGTVILLYREDEFGGRFTQLMNDSSCVLRVRSTLARGATPFGWWCTGAIKALLGVRSRALCPRSLARHLLRHGAEVVRLAACDA
jgi:hypothetical protein